MALTMLACGHLGDRTTIVYGNVYDENQQPVDSIMVMVSGLKLKGAFELKSTFTDENGDYEIVLEVPRTYGSVKVNIPYLPRNTKFEEKYKIRDRIGPSSKPMIGKKTQWDFQLEPK
jgi:hypothetical protein